MTEKKSKYDTNPLPEDIVREAEEVFAYKEPFTTTEPQPAPTIRHTESGTRPYKENFTEPYQSVFTPTMGQTTGNQPLAKGHEQSTLTSKISPQKLPLTSRNVEGLSLPENIVMIVPYIPFMIGAIGALVTLFLVPRHETRVRFHAAQGLALHIAVFIISSVLGFVGGIMGSGMGSILFSVATTVFFIISIIRVWQGEPHHISPLDDATNWLNEKIGPKK